MKPARIFLAAMAAVGLLLSGARASSITDPWPSVANVAVTITSPWSVTTLDFLVGAADAGDAEAMNSLGVLYFMGTSVPRDYATALLWFQKAVDDGSTNAMSNLGTMYLLGAGVPRDPANAFRWFGRSAAHGNVKSMYIAAVMADEGLGTTRDAPLARTLYREAAESGFAAAMVRLSESYAASGGTRNLVEAYAWLVLATQSALPDEVGIVVLARMEKLGARLAPEHRDQARALAMHRLADMRTRAVTAQRAPTEMELGMRTAPGGASAW
jgi:TPR repeat protein